MRPVFPPHSCCRYAESGRGGPTKRGRAAPSACLTGPDLDRATRSTRRDRTQAVFKHPSKWRQSGRISPGSLMVLLALAAAGAAGSWYLLSGSANSAGTGRVTTQQATTVWFEEVAEQSGLTFRHVRTPVVRYWLPEIMSGGAGLFDYDNDGDMDLYLVQAGDLDPTAADKPGNRLYRNRGDGTFDDVTAAAGVADTGYGDGCACGDYDGDGDVDLYVTNVGPNVLYRNNGDGTFTDVTAAAGVGDPGWGCSAAFFDYDADGDLDLMVVNYVIWSIQAEIKCAIITARPEVADVLVHVEPHFDPAEKR